MALTALGDHFVFCVLRPTPDASQNRKARRKMLHVAA